MMSKAMEVNGSGSPDPFFDAEMKFRRYFTTYPDRNFRERFPGRLEVLEFGDETLNNAIEALRSEINKRYFNNMSRITPPDDMKGIHMDYLRSQEPNALAFYVDDLACIAVTEPAIRRVLDIASRIAVAPAVVSMLQLTNNGGSVNSVAGSFFTMMMQNLTNHELGHIFHGHCFETARSLPRAEMVDVQAPCFSHNVEWSMRRQAAEVDADGYAAHMVLKNLFTGGAANALTNYLGSTLQGSELGMRFFLLSLGALFYLWGPRRFDAERVEHCDHPPALVRLNVFMRDMEGWCSEHQPSLVGWGTLERFQQIMETIASIDSEPSARDVWERQGIFMRSSEGISYRERLYEKREQLRSEMFPHQWQLGSER
jgi:hypothetical protein